MGSNTDSQAQNMISTVQIVATRVLNLSSKFQLDQTTNEAGSTLWWNRGNEMCFSFPSYIFSVFPFPYPFLFLFIYLFLL